MGHTNDAQLKGETFLAKFDRVTDAVFDKAVQTWLCAVPSSLILGGVARGLVEGAERNAAQHPAVTDFLTRGAVLSFDGMLIGAGVLAAATAGIVGTAATKAVAHIPEVVSHVVRDLKEAGRELRRGVTADLDEARASTNREAGR
ncbi:MAG: hypothetical protein PW734_04930 [Verrucomicrobium sp.]|nr:hypothetical protein [Verrucomicrobium sp.]